MRQAVIPKKQGIYQWRNTIDNKLYIGSSVNLQHRKHIHTHELRTGKSQCPHLRNAWDKYGEAVFVFEVIEIMENCSIRELRLREAFYINQFDTVANGYNSSYVVKDQRGTSHSQSVETRAKISKANKGRTSSLRGVKYSSERIAIQTAILNKGRLSTKELSVKITESWDKRRAEGKYKKVHDPESIKLMKIKRKEFWDKKNSNNVLTDDRRKEIIERYKKGGITQAKLMLLYGISVRTLRSVLCNLPELEALKNLNKTLANKAQWGKGVRNKKIIIL